MAGRMKIIQGAPFGALGFSFFYQQGIDDRRVGQGAGVAEVLIVTFGHFSQDAAHDLAGTGFG
jgi:hypothetical protein